MRDSVNASLIPQSTDVVCGYGDGAISQWSSADWARFPNSIKLSIVVNPVDIGDILDIENGDATPSDAPGWCDRFNRPGRRAPTLYCNRSTWPAVQAAVGSRHVDYWIATLDGTMAIPGAVAVQYVDTGAYDDSNILDLSWVGGSPMVVSDRVVPSSPVSGRIYQNAQWYNWSDLTPLQTTDQTGSTGQNCTWTEAILVSGVWYDRINGGDWCLKDSDVDDGGFDPTHFRPVAPPPPPPAPTPPPPTDPTAAAIAALTARVTALEAKDAAIRAALS